MDSLHVHRDALSPGARVIVLDDVLATGGTAKAKVELVEGLGGLVAGIVFVLELTFLNGRDRLSGYDVHSLIQY
jgi:adenine phosphoribosyltransferase